MLVTRMDQKESNRTGRRLSARPQGCFPTPTERGSMYVDQVLGGKRLNPPSSQDGGNTTLGSFMGLFC